MALPQGSSIIVPTDSCIMNALIECDKALKSSGLSADKFDPLTLDTALFTNRTNLDPESIEYYNKIKLVMFALYRVFTEHRALQFISPTVLSELNAIGINKDNFRHECFSFINKYAVMPAIVYDEHNQPCLDGAKEADELARRYCKPYDFVYFDKESSEIKTSTSKYSPMHATSAKVVKSLSRSLPLEEPENDAYVMAYASIFRLSLLTFNAEHFIGLTNKIRRGIVTINSKYLGVEYKDAPSPILPSDLYNAMRREKNKETGIIDLSPLDIDEFLKVLAHKFGTLDLHFISRASEVLNLINVDYDDPLDIIDDDYEA